MQQHIWIKPSGLIEHRQSGLSTHLQDVDVGGAVGPLAAAVHLDVFQPLDVRLRVAVNLTMELHVTAHLHRLVGRQPRLEDGPVGGALCGGEVAALSRSHKSMSDGHVTSRTQDVQLVGVGDGAVLVLHHAGVVPPVRRNGALHHQAPLLVPQLERGQKGSGGEGVPEVFRLLPVSGSQEKPPETFKTSLCSLPPPLISWVENIREERAGCRARLQRRPEELKRPSTCFLPAGCTTDGNGRAAAFGPRRGFKINEKMATRRISRGFFIRQGSVRTRTPPLVKINHRVEG